MNDIAAAFGETDEQPEHETPVVLQMSREEQLTQLHQVKADALATVRPLRELTVARNGLKAVVDGRKAVVKLRTGVDKRRKALNAEAKAWIDTVNATAKEILAIIEPVEDHLKTQEVIHERQKREAEEAERAERIALRRATWPADAGEFSEAEAGSMDAISWAGHTMVRIQNERRRLEQEREHAAERAELEEYRRLKEERDREFADRLQAKVAELKPVEPVTEPVVLPVSEGVGRMADEIRETWREPVPEPVAVAPVAPAKSGPSAESRLGELIESLREIIRMRGDVDWRGLITEAITDATR